MPANKGSNHEYLSSLPARWTLIERSGSVYPKVTCVWIIKNAPNFLRTSQWRANSFESLRWRVAFDRPFMTFQLKSSLGTRRHISNTTVRNTVEHERWFLASSKFKKFVRIIGNCFPYTLGELSASIRSILIPNSTNKFTAKKKFSGDLF